MKGRRAPILALLLALLLVLPGCEPLNQALAAPALDEDFSLSDIPGLLRPALRGGGGQHAAVPGGGPGPRLL